MDRCARSRAVRLGVIVCLVAAGAVGLRQDKAAAVWPATGNIGTVAGTGVGSYSGDGSAATTAALQSPESVAVDGAANVYVADTANSRIRRVDAVTGIISTVAGTGVAGFSGDGGAANAARLDQPAAVAVDPAGNLLIADTGNNRVRSVNRLGLITTVAGDGTPAELSGPRGVAFAAGGSLLIADTGNDRVRSVDGAGVMSTIVGTNGQLSGPTAIAVDAADRLFIADTGNNVIRKGVDSGYPALPTDQRFSPEPRSSGAAMTLGMEKLTAQDYRVYVNGTAVGEVHGITTAGGSTLFAGAFNGSQSNFEYVRAYDAKGGTLLSDSGPFAGFGDPFGNPAVVQNVAGAGYVEFRVWMAVSDDHDCWSSVHWNATGSTNLYNPSGFNLFVRPNGQVFTIEQPISAGLVLQTVAGNTNAGYTGDGGPATSARLNQPSGLALDADNFYIADANNNVVRGVDAAGAISTVAGTGASGYSGDGGAATAAKLAHPTGIAIDTGGNLSIADTGNHVVRHVADGNWIISDRARHYGLRRSSAYAGDPVNTATGNFTTASTDLDMAPPVFGLDWSRSYNAQNAASTALGLGWSPGFGMEVVENGLSGDVTVTDVDGRVATFAKWGGSYLRPEEFFASLSKHPDGTFSLAYDDGHTVEFDGSGNMEARQNWDGQRVDFSYTSGRLTAATSNAGYALTFTYTSGLLTRVDASDSRHVAYGYTAGKLTSVTDAAGGTTQYAYDSGGRLSRITDPDGVIEIENVYDAKARVASQTTTSGDAVSFSYDDTTGVTSVTHAGAAAVTSYAHDHLGRALSVTDANGKVLSKSYDSSGNVVSITDRRGAIASQTFDGHGNLLTRSGPEGVHESFTYDGLDRMLTASDGEGETTTYAYDGTERLPTTVTDAENKVTTYDVGADGLVDAVTDADGVTSAFGYDAKRNPTTMTDAAGKVTTLGYDAAGNRTSVSTPLARVTALTFDGLRRPLTTTDPTGAVTSRTWTPAGRLATETDAETKVTTFAYDTAGRVHTVTDALNNVTTYGYDADGNVTSISRPGNPSTPMVLSTWTATYDKLGRRTSETDPSGVVTTYGFDDDGNLTTTTDENGGVRTSTYDLRGRVTKERDPLEHDSTYVYDKADRVTSVTDALGNATSFGYDGVGRLLTTTRPGGRVSAIAYTDAGRVLSRTDENGETTVNGYDSRGRLHTVTSPESHVTTYGYDDDGRPTSVTSAAGLVTGFGYDDALRRTTVTAPAGGVTTRTFTARGQLSVLDEPDTAPRSFFYDAVGRLERARDPLGHDTVSSFDGRGNVISRTDARGKAESYAYDLADRLLSRTDALSRTTSVTYDNLGRTSAISDPSSRSAVFGYDAAGRVTSKSFTGTGLAPVIVTYGYDDANRRTSMTDGTGTTTYGYDAVGALTSTVAAGKTLGFGYDLAGNRTSLTYPDGSVAGFTFDGDNRLVGLSHPQAGAVAYTYDADGRVLTEDLPGADARSYGYTFGRQSSFSQTIAGATRSTSVARDLADRITSETTAGATTTYGYDPAGQLTSAIGGSSSSNSTFTYDAVGNRTAKVNGSLRTDYAFDDASQLTSATRKAGGVTLAAVSFGYDGAGRMTAVGAGSGTTSRTLGYDAAGRLSSVVTARGPLHWSTLRASNGDGSLVGVTTTAPSGSPKTTALGWDHSVGVPQVATSSSGGVDTNYLYGIGRALALRGGQADAFAVDVHGSTLASGEAADLAASGSYDEWGKPLPSSAAQPLIDEVLGFASGSSPDQRVAFGYRGETTVDGLLHLRAREYMPTTGAFTTVDPLAGIPGEVTVANPYPYAANDPLNLVDPLGLTPVRDAELRAAFAGLTDGEFEVMRHCAVDAYTGRGGGARCRQVRETHRLHRQVVAEEIDLAREISQTPDMFWRGLPSNYDRWPDAQRLKWLKSVFTMQDRIDMVVSFALATKQAGITPRVSKVAPDWITKGAHIHIDDVELAVRPGASGTVVFKPVFGSSGPGAVNAAIASAEAALATDPRFRAQLLRDVARALPYVASQPGALAQGKSAELYFLMKALLKMEGPALR